MSIVFVDKDDNIVGAGGEREAYDKGIPHRSTRIFLFNAAGKVLLVKRAETVKILPGKWGESVAGHVDEGESYEAAALREIAEEIGVTGLALTELGKFFVDIIDGPRHIVRFNTVFSAPFDGELSPNPAEVGEMKWFTVEEITSWMKEKPDDFTPGSLKSFGIYLTRLTN